MIKSRYTDEEKQQAKSWLSSHGYPPTRAGAEQAYQDYMDGKIDVPEADAYMGKNQKNDIEEKKNPTVKTETKKDKQSKNSTRKFIYRTDKQQYNICKRINNTRNNRNNNDQSDNRNKRTETTKRRKKEKRAERNKEKTHNRDCNRSSCSRDFCFTCSIYAKENVKNAMLK